MKILYITNFYPSQTDGGSEWTCDSVNRAMQARGHETLVLTSMPKGSDEKRTEAGVIRSLRLHDTGSDRCPSFSELQRVEKQNNEALLQTLAVFKPDAVHVFHLDGVSKSLAHTLQRADVPTAYYVSEPWMTEDLASDPWLQWWNGRPHSLAHGIGRNVLSYSGVRAWIDQTAPTQPSHDLEFRRMYFSSKPLQDRAVSAGYDVSHAAIIPMGVDTRRFSPRPSSSRDEGAQKLLFVGRLLRDKGIRTVLRALARIRGSFTGSLTVCGHGEPIVESEMRDLARRLHLDVEFVNPPASEMAELYRHHDALIFSSECEPLNALTPMEAMACGLPVVVTKGGCSEIFRHGTTALCFSEGDDEDLARQILTLQLQPEVGDRIATAGCAEIRCHFRMEQILDRIEQYIRETAERWPSQHGVPTAPPEKRMQERPAFA